MLATIRSMATAVLLTLALAFTSPASAATDVIQQIKLDDKMIEGFIASQKDMEKVAEKLQTAPADKPDPKIQGELEQVAKKHGFKDFAEYDDVAANISMIMAGIDPQSGSFTDPVDQIKREIEEVKADKSIKESDRKTMIEELNEALKVTQPIKFPDNVALVRKFRAKIEAVLR